jgi:hypothetical protein
MRPASALKAMGRTFTSRAAFDPEYSAVPATMTTRSMRLAGGHARRHAR